MRYLLSVIVAAIITGCAASNATTSVPMAGSKNASSPTARPVLEEPTLRCLGAYWIIRGDDNANARVEVEYRVDGTGQAGKDATAGQWRRGADLFRVAKDGTTQVKIAGPGQKLHDPELVIPGDCWLFAGSIIDLAPDTPYEIRLRLVDPDGMVSLQRAGSGPTMKLNSPEVTLKARTIGEPVAPAPLHTWHVVPGNGGGTGSAADPFKGFATAELAAKAGDLVLIHAGVYNETLNVNDCGAPGKPIIFRAAGDGEAVIDGRDQMRYGVKAWLLHDVWFEGLTIRNVAVGVSANDSHHVVIRRCNIKTSMYGICFNGNHTNQVSNFFVSDNTIEGPISWPRKGGVENPGGLYMAGRGHVVCYNRVHGFADGIDTYHSHVCCAIDIHNNDISECTDDGSEMDFSERNTRNFDNRYTNVFQGVSEQPIFGGPTYIFRNTFYNIELEPFKLHHCGTPTAEVNYAPSGAIIFHNTIVKKGMPSIMWSGPAQTVFNCVSRNNLYVGTEEMFACEFTSEMAGCDFDYDGFAGMLGRTPPSTMPSTNPKQPKRNRVPATARTTPFDDFLFWNQVTYKTLADVKARSPVERHAVELNSAEVFASGLLPPKAIQMQFDNTMADFRLKAGCGAIDAGQIMPGLNDGFSGKAPDLGAIEFGKPPPHYGPR